MTMMTNNNNKGHRRNNQNKRKKKIPKSNKINNKTTIPTLKAIKSNAK